ncbi:rubrerythrin-like domain-containing protein [Halarchaeum sp. P4]
MRPTVEVDGVQEYECLECGARVADPDGRVCADCDSTLRNLGRERDL